MKDAHMGDVIRNLNNFVRKDIVPFKTDDEILEKALWIIELRKDFKSHSPVFKREETSLSLERNSTAVFHRRLNDSTKKLHIVRTAKRLRLNRTEKEILLLLSLARLGILRRINDLEDIQKFLFCVRLLNVAPSQNIVSF